MFRTLVDLAVIGLAIWILLWIVRKWKSLDLEAKKDEIEKIEEQHKTVTEVEKKHPNYRKKKEHVEKFKRS